ncbi:MAG: choline/carnitine O-acyltransferase [Micropruina sp.]|uniref:choline/carnitine O-acyltransferase n=1 Tax=Micropruina sp. TaxID=2737536 RepID=UPI0039E288D3
MRTLPVPPLSGTLERYRAAVGPLLTDADRDATAARVEAFAENDGPALQAELEAFAAAEDAAGRSWLSEAWLDGYLTSRGPITLTSNVGFLLNWPGSATGIERAADLVHRMAAVHLGWLRGELPPESTPRGDELDPQQLRYLAGGLRHPRPGADEFIEGPGQAADREIVVFRGGAPFVLRISDGAGQPLSVPAIAAGLTGLLGRAGADSAGFTRPSYAGSEPAAALLDRLLADEANAAGYDRLTRALFAVNLADDGLDADGYLQRATFGLGRTWVYKPATYDIDLATGLASVQMEHTVVDGATLKRVVALAQQVVPDLNPGAAPEAEPLHWRLDDALAADIDAAAGRYAEQAADYRVRTVAVPLPAPGRPSFKLSLDGVQQWVMLFAQLAYHGGAPRGTYEAVDMREYQAGRTECLRPVTAEAVALARGLRAGEAVPEQLFAAMAAHKGWVIACKTGNGIDRHLFGLRLMAARSGRTPELFADPAYTRLTTDYLSTTSLGDPHQLVRFAFAPTSAGGIGISYSSDAGVLEFCLSYRASEHDDIEAFAQALTEGTQALGDLITRAS